jgi:hypothetical protein
MISKVNLNGLSMYVSSTADQGVVDQSTRLLFYQREARVLARYQGGMIQRGVLIGRVLGGVLTFRYLQVEASGEIHGGRSICNIVRTPEGKIRIIENFQWTTRNGSGTNVFDEVPV